MATLSYCAEFVRTHDRNRYLCTLFVPAELREAWFAIFAFQQEIASIADKIGEEMVGFIRYAWWREVLDAVCNNSHPRGHPVAEALAQVVAKHHLPRELFEKIIDAHEKAMAAKQPLDELFFLETTVPLMQLCAAVASVETLNSLAISFAALEAALLPHTDEEHKTQFIALARTKLEQAKPVAGVFASFAHLVEFYLKKLERNKPVLDSDKAFWLPLYLWRKRGITC